MDTSIGRRAGYWCFIGVGVLDQGRLAMDDSDAAEPRTTKVEAVNGIESLR